MGLCPSRQFVAELRNCTSTAACRSFEFCRGEFRLLPESSEENCLYEAEPSFRCLADTELLFYQRVLPFILITLGAGLVVALALMRRPGRDWFGLVTVKTLALSGLVALVGWTAVIVHKARETTGLEGLYYGVLAVVAVAFSMCGMCACFVFVFVCFSSPRADRPAAEALLN
jgi:hypothetical protein